jgi:tRNA(Ile)-lysidine synthase
VRPEGRSGRGGRPHPAVAAIRYAVRTRLADLAERVGRDDGLVLVACSGGADSLALAEALAFECLHSAWSGGAVVVDHGLQADSGAVAGQAAGTCRRLGLDPVEVLRVDVVPGGHGLEAAAREARYGALTEAAGRLGAVAVLLGHTLDDQAEQVLLGLARGSGARSLSGMPARRGVLERPLLAITRSQTRAACGAEGLQVWDDPMNTDPAFTRVRARGALADLERDLGPGITDALARSADQLRADADLLDTLAEEARRGLGPGPDHDVSTFAAIPAALRTRVWRLLLIEAGAPAGQTGAAHTDACDRLLTHWRGQGPLHVPGDLRVTRTGTTVRIERPGPVE